MSLQVFNPAGHGPATTVSVMTDEGGESFARKSSMKNDLKLDYALSVSILLSYARNLRAALKLSIKQGILYVFTISAVDNRYLQGACFNRVRNRNILRDCTLTHGR